MLRNYFTIALRNFWKHKGFSALNLFGLTIGLTTCLLITLFVVSELGYDRFNANADRIVRVTAHFKIDGQDLNERLSPADLGPAMVRDYPQVTAFMRMHDQGPVKIRKGNEFLVEPRAVFADSTFFAFFTIHVLAGSPQSALTQPRSVVLSATAAAKYFPGQTAVGQTMLIGDTTPYKVTAVMEDMPALSHIHLDIIRSLSTQGDSREVNWVNNDYNTYLLLKPGVKNIDGLLAQATRKYADPALRKNANTSLDALEKKGDFYRYETIPLTRIHLHSQLAREAEPSGNITYVRIFMLTAILILLIACVNFMNLSTARSAGRSKEVGVRKVLGSGRGALVGQFLTESVILCVTATLLSVIATIFLLSWFNRLSGQHLSAGSLPWSWLAPALILGSVGIGLLAGSYPALVLSAFMPIQVLKGKLRAGFKGSWFRNVLVVFQFTTAIALIISTMVIYSQLSYIRHKRLGFNRDQVLILKNTGALGDHALTYKHIVQQIPGVQGATLGSSFPTSNEPEAEAIFKDAAMTQVMGPERWMVDPDYIPTLGMTLSRGRNFSAQMPSDSAAIIINETFVTQLGYKDPLKEKLYGTDNNGKNLAMPIIGVVKDFNTGSLRQPIPSMMFQMGYDNSKLAVHLSADHTEEVIRRMEAEFRSMPGTVGQPFQFTFMDEDFNNLYQTEVRMGQIFTVFTFLAVLVACLGLFGLITYAVEQRAKEISIRKVLGAGTGHLVTLLSRDFLGLVGVATLISFPLAWWGMHKWLEGFAYRTAISPWIFAGAALGAFGITLATIGYKAFRAAMTNPVKSLKVE